MLTNILQLIEKLSNRRKFNILITAGPTAEDIDDVRFITNRSTGKMGLEIAKAALKLQTQPLLIMGPTHINIPEEIACFRVRSAKDMHQAVIDGLKWCDALVMTAAVADYTPAEKIKGKLKKKPGDLILKLTRTVDILKDVAKNENRKNKIIVGFSLDEKMNIEVGKKKLVDKNLDFLIVNTISTFGAEKINAEIIIKNKENEKIGNLNKSELAEVIINKIIKLKNRN